MTRPLEGIKVVELGSYIAIPKAARIMADWGASVVKIEPPSGEAWRYIGRAWNFPYDPDNNPLFQAENANKKSIVLDLKTQDGLKVTHKLLESADVLLTSTRARALTKLGLDYETIKKCYPQLIYAQFSGYGETGPAKDDPGFDTAAFWARAGILIEWSADGAVPFKPQPGFGDSTCASTILSGVLAALFARERTGKGEFIQTSLYAASLWYNSSGVIMGQEKYGQHFPKRKEDFPNAFSPMYQTKDGDWIITSTTTWDKHVRGVYKVLGMDKYINDPRYCDLDETRKHLVEVIDLIQAHFRTKTTAEIVDGFTAIDMVHAKLVHPNDVTKDEQAWVNGYLRKLRLECGDEVAVPNTPIKFAGVSEMPYELAPHLGANSREILESLGYGQQEIQDMIENRSVSEELLTKKE